jgi:hypothetical protein
MNSYSLKNLTTKCRCCFQPLKGEIVEITEQSQMEFLSITQIELKLDPAFSNFFCFSCDQQIANFAKFKSDASERQTSMYEEYNIPIVSNAPMEIIEENMIKLECEDTSDMPNVVYLEEKNHDYFECEDNEENDNFAPEIFNSQICQLIANIKNEPAAYNCKQCRKKFDTEKGLRQHYIAIHKPKDLTCEICNIEYPTFNMLRRHRDEFHTDTFECKICNKKFENDKKFTTHMTFVHEKNIECKLKGCDKRFATIGAMKKHYDIVHLVSYTKT